MNVNEIPNLRRKILDISSKKDWTLHYMLWKLLKKFPFIKIKGQTLTGGTITSIYKIHNNNLLVGKQQSSTVWKSNEWP